MNLRATEELSACGTEFDVVASEVVDRGLGQHGVVLKNALIYLSSVLLMTSVTYTRVRTCGEEECCQQ